MNYVTLLKVILLLKDEDDHTAIKGFDTQGWNVEKVTTKDPEMTNGQIRQAM